MQDRGRVLLAACFLLAGAPAALASPPPGVDALMRQADFWRHKGRPDLAIEAYKRVLALDPANGGAKAALANLDGGAAAPTPPAPPPSQVSPADAGPAPDGPAAAKPQAPAEDPSAKARAAGFAALNANNIPVAEADFREALARRRTDADAMGGLGVAELRQGRFAEARVHLAVAARQSEAKWGRALKAAAFYADLRSAEAARDQGNFDEAERIARELEARGDDETFSAGRLLADLLTRKGEDAEALDLYRAALARLKDGPDAAAVRGAALRLEVRVDQAQGRTAQAAEALQKAIGESPQDPWLRHDYARILLSEGKRADAEAVIEPLTVRGASPDALQAAALILDEMGHSDAAAQLLARVPAPQMSAEMRKLALQVEVRQGVARAKALSGAGRTAEALAELQTLAGRQGVGPAAEGEVALGLWDLGRRNQAAEIALAAAKDRTADASSYISLVIVLSRAGQDQAAAALIEDLAKRGGNAPAITKLRASAVAASADRLRGEGQLATAFDLLQSAWAMAPGDDDLLGATARLYEAGRMPAQAGQVYQLILQKHPEETSAWIGLARAAAAANSKRVALDALAKATSLAKDDPDVFVSASDIAGQMGDRRAALAYLAQARKILDASNMLAGGAAFPAKNPFVDRARPGASPVRVLNPFELASVSGRGLELAAPSGPSGVAADTSRALLDSRSQSGPTATPWLDAAPAPAGGSGGRSEDRSGVFALLGQQAPVGAPAPQDTTLAAINSRIDALQQAQAPYVKAQVGVRSRSGESGLSALNAVSADLQAQAQLGPVKLTASVQPVALEAGALSRSALARYGTNATPEAEGIVARQPSQLVLATGGRTSGAGFAVSAGGGGVTGTVGVTPLGFQHVNVLGRLGVERELASGTTVSLYAERQPVTDSVTSYAGSRDPVTGKIWGAVMRNQVGASVSHDRDGTGFYLQANVRAYEGQSVQSNDAAEVNAGVYTAAHLARSSTLSVGANVNFQGYRHDQDFFTFGHGGYFSPQNFAAVSLPINLKTSLFSWNLNLDVSPGYQNYNEALAPVYPSSPVMQARLDQLKAQDIDVRAQYDATGKSGFAVNSGLFADHQLTGREKLSFGVTYNTFGQFNELQAFLGLQQAY